MSTIEKALAKQKAAQANLENAEKVESAAIEQTPADSVKTESKPLITEQKTEQVAASGEKPVLKLEHNFLLSKGLIVGGHDEAHRTKEEFRHIKRKILNNAFGPGAKTLNNSKLVMVTSSNPNEGKTFVSLNMALSIALEQDKTVLLVDADVLRPSVSRELGFPELDGLVEYLLSEVTDVKDIIYNTEIPNLKVIPAGKPHYLTNELLASDRMASLAQELAHRYPDRIVIFDSPPLLGVTETPVLASLMGQALIVVEESKTRLADVKYAASQLDENLAVGLVMNKAIKSHKDVYGYYGYGYRRENPKT